MSFEGAPGGLEGFEQCFTTNDGQEMTRVVTNEARHDDFSSF